MENTTIARTLARLLEAGYASVFESKTGNGHAYGQFLCPDGSSLSIEVDTNGCVTVRSIHDSVPDSLEFDQILVEAGLAP